MAPTACARRSSCLNCELVVLDTSVLIHILQFLCWQYQSRSESEPVVKSFDDLCFGLEYFLDGMLCCAQDDTLHVSSLVYNNEIDLVSKNSSIRRQVSFPTQIMRPLRSQCYSQIHQVLTRSLSLTDVDDELVRVLRRACAGWEDVSDEDVSLIGLAIKKSDSVQQVGVLSFDERLVDWGREIRKLDTLACEGQRLSTRRISPENGLTFLASIHECCELDTSPYEELVQYVEKQDLDRYDDLNPLTAKRKWRRYLRLRQELTKGRRRKDRRARLIAR